MLWMTRFSLIVSVLTLSALVLSGYASAKDVLKETPSGGIDWSQGIVFATGYGTAKAGLPQGQRRILSRRAAIVDAQRNLLEITKGVRISSALVTDQAMKENLVITSKIEGIIRGAKVTKDHYQNDVATINMTMPISGEFLRIMYPAERLALSPAKISGSLDQQPRLAGAGLLGFATPPAGETFSVTSESEANAYRKLMQFMHGNASAELKNMLQQAVIEYESNARFSGLLIDARSVPDFELATIPKIRDESGNILYPTRDTSYDDIVNKRGVSYDFDLDDAIKNRRVAMTPFIVKAISIYKSLPSDLVIADSDSAEIKLNQSTMDAMNNAGVLIVVAL